MRVAVVGAGIMGASAARFLAADGHSVDLIEQFMPGHTNGSSHGSSRIVRKAYPDPFFTEIMAEGYPMWADLAKESGHDLLHECGLMYYGNSEADNVKSLVNGLTNLSVPFETLGPHDATRVFPSLRLNSGEVGIFTPEAGYVNATMAVLASIGLAQSKGANLLRYRVQNLDEVTAKYDKVILCAGGWIKRFFELPTKVTLQTVVYVAGQLNGPVWIEDDDGGMSHYGFPSYPGHDRFKVGIHLAGKEIDPDSPERDPDPERVERILETVGRRFGIASPQAVEVQACLYTSKVDEEFMFGEHGKVLWASPCSGHGFKFGPWVGRFLADIVEGRKLLTDYPRLCFDARRVS